MTATNATTCTARLPISASAASPVSALVCDLTVGEHSGLNHHDPAHGVWWCACDLSDHQGRHTPDELEYGSAYGEALAEVAEGATP